MALKEVTLSRAFKFNGISLADPSPEMNLEAVKRFFANQFPELLNSVIEGPVTKAQVSTYTFTRAAGAKGSDTGNKPVLEVIQQMALGNGDKTSLFTGLTPQQIKENAQCSTVLHTVVMSNSVKHPLPLPQQAFGIWG